MPMRVMPLDAGQPLELLLVRPIHHRPTNFHDIIRLVNLGEIDAEIDQSVYISDERGRRIISDYGRHFSLRLRFKTENDAFTFKMKYA